MEKYEILHNDVATTPLGQKVFRIRALRTIPYVVKAGELGGYIAKEDNLSQTGACWVGENAMAFDDARIYENAILAGRALAYGKAYLRGAVHVRESAIIRGNAILENYAEVYGTAIVEDDARIFQRAAIFDNAQVRETAEVSGTAKVHNFAKLSGACHVTDFSRVFGNAKIRGGALIRGHSQVFGDTVISNQEYLSGNAVVPNSDHILYFCGLGQLLGFSDITICADENGAIFVGTRIFYSEERFLELLEKEKGATAVATFKAFAKEATKHMRMPQEIPEFA